MEASEAMRGHHPESCPRRALQQGELWVDIEPCSGAACQRVYKASGTSQNCTRTFVNLSSTGAVAEEAAATVKKMTSTHASMALTIALSMEGQVHGIEHGIKHGIERSIERSIEHGIEHGIEHICNRIWHRAYGIEHGIEHGMST